MTDTEVIHPDPVTHDTVVVDDDNHADLAALHEVGWHAEASDKACQEGVVGQEYDELVELARYMRAHPELYPEPVAEEQPQDDSIQYPDRPGY